MELLEAETAYTTTRLPLLRARQDARTQRETLAHLMGWPEAEPPAIRGRLAVETLTVDREALVRQALEQRPDVRLVDQDIRVREQEMLAIKLTNTPSVSAVGAYEFVQRARNDLPQNVWSGGVVLSWPIFEGNTLLPRLQAARLALDAASLRREQLRASVALEVRLEVSAEAHQTQQAAVATARERERLARVALKAGTMLPVEVANVELELVDARLAETQLRFDRVMARARLGHLVGAPPGGFQP
jgi:outer membrane protein TolC